MDYVDKYMAILRDPSYPENRIFRKVAVMAAIMIFMMIFYRHVVLGFGFFQPVIVTIGLGFLLFAIVGLLGAVLAGALYLEYLKWVSTREHGVKISVHAVEWLFALCAPILGFLLLLFLNFQHSLI
jgi:hypothetical protein